MKKQSILCLALLFVFSLGCQDHSSSLKPTSEADYSVSIDEARKVALSIEIGDSITTTSKSVANGRVKLQYRKIVQEATFVSATTSETALYIFNYSKGFVVISDDKRLLPILALSDKGSFDNNTQHLGVQDWVASAKKVITTAREEKLSQSKTTAAAWE